MMVADEDMYAEEDVIEDRVLNAMDLVIKKIDLTRKDIDMQTAKKLKTRNTLITIIRNSIDHKGKPCMK